MDFKVANYLPTFFVAAGIGFIIGGPFIIAGNLWLGIGLMLLGVILITTQYRMEINMTQKYYREYVWFLGIKTGAKIPFEEIHYFYITRSKKTKVYGQTYKNHYVTGACYNGYTKFSENEKIFIGDSDSKDSILERIAKINTVLKLDIMDYSA